MLSLLPQLVSWISMYVQTDEKEGQGLVEYALIIVLIAVVIVGALSGLEGAISGVFSTISGSLGSSGS